MRTFSIIHHRVADFDAWKQVYDGVHDMQSEGGVRFHQVLRSQEDPSMVVVTHAFDSREAADAFFANPQLGPAMERAGVDASSLQVEHLEEVEAGDL